MWAIVVVDLVAKKAIVSRDRLGIKPLYIWRREGYIALASEIKQFHALATPPRALNREGCALYILTGYEDPKGSLFRDVEQMAPGCWQEIDLSSLAVGQPTAYWHPERLQPTISDPTQAAQLLRDKLLESVRLHLRSDVPVGCALSGGLDSSAVATLIDSVKNGQTKPLFTFSVVFPGCNEDERTFVDAVLKRIVGEPYFTTPSYSSFLEDLNRFLWVQDEPTASLSQYAGYCLSRLTREMEVPVVLNGQGGDEGLGGYWQLYFTYLLSLVRSAHYGRACAHLAGSLLGDGNPQFVRQLPRMLTRYRSRTRALVPIKMDGVDASTVVGSSRLVHYINLNPQAQRISEIRDMFLPQLLKWDDRNFMAFGVEGRYPFLDHEVLELCLQFERSVLYDRGWTKCPLRNGLAGLFPEEIRWRRTKLGFETPQNQWLCGPLRPTFECWLDAERPAWGWVEQSDAKEVAHHVWASPRANEGRKQLLIRLFMFDHWLERFNLPA
jgi:asparagine synthase (glutamine-hydrolysing)